MRIYSHIIKACKIDVVSGTRMPISKLIFFPKSTTEIIGNKTLMQSLIKSQFIIVDAHKNNHYLPSERFLSLITFLGCSPNINLFPVDGEDHCFISFIEASEQAICVGHTNTVNPKCPACTKRITNWQTTNWQLARKICTCDKCQQQTPYADLNWKQECGFARCGFVVNHIYPHEAVPTDQLLDLLKQVSKFDWDYCYANN